MLNIVQTANEYLVKNHITSTELSLDRMYSLAEDAGCVIHTYASDVGHSLIEALNLSKFTVYKAFTFCAQGRTIILLDDQLSSSQKIFAIAHELGHLVCRHTSDCNVLGYSDDPALASAQEMEADTFACQILAPACVLRAIGVTSPTALASMTSLGEDERQKVYTQYLRYRNDKTLSDNEVLQGFKYFIELKRDNTPMAPDPVAPNLISAREETAKPAKQSIPWAILAAVLTVVFITVGICGNIYYDRQQADAAARAQIVYIASGGDKYHLAGCQYIAGKDNLTALTAGEATDKGYAPCKVCFSKK